MPNLFSTILIIKFIKIHIFGTLFGILVHGPNMLNLLLSILKVDFFIVSLHKMAKICSFFGRHTIFSKHDIFEAPL